MINLEQAIDTFTRRINTIFGSDLTADGRHHGTGSLSSVEWWAYNQVVDAAYHYNALWGRVASLYKNFNPPADMSINEKVAWREGVHYAITYLTETP